MASDGRSDGGSRSADGAAGRAAPSAAAAAAAASAPPLLPPLPATAGQLDALLAEMKDFVLDATAGTVGGVLGVLTGNPFDVVKTRMQAGRVYYANAMACVREIVRVEGPRAFYKGSLVASLGQAPNNFLTFGHYGFAMRVLERLWPSAPAAAGAGAGAGGDARPQHPQLAHVYVAGSWAGAAQSLALAPFEHIKVQQQLMGEATGSRLPLLAATRAIYQARGVAHGLMRGWVATAWRDVPTFGLYFSSFELTKKLYADAQRARRAAAGGDASDGGAITYPHWVLLAGGGIAGIASWSLALPADVIKSNIQGSPIDTPREHTRFLTMARTLYAKHGAGVFVRGIVPCLVRSVPVNAVTFAVYEVTLNQMRTVTGIPIHARDPEDVMR